MTSIKKIKSTPARILPRMPEKNDGATGGRGVASAAAQPAGSVTPLFFAENVSQTVVQNVRFEIRCDKQRHRATIRGFLWVRAQRAGCQRASNTAAEHFGSVRALCTARRQSSSSDRQSARAKQQQVARRERHRNRQRSQHRRRRIQSVVQRVAARRRGTALSLSASVGWRIASPLNFFPLAVCHIG